LWALAPPIHIFKDKTSQYDTSTKCIQQKRKGQEKIKNMQSTNYFVLKLFFETTTMQHFTSSDQKYERPNIPMQKEIFCISFACLLPRYMNQTSKLNQSLNVSEIL
jgi:hypothetical protein